MRGQAYTWPMDDLVSTQWLANHLAEVVPVDSSWFMPSSGRNGHAEFIEAHIPGARFFDIDAIADTAHAAPHMLPSAEHFGRAMQKIGIGRDDRIVVYDNSPLRTAARGWFMLRHFGAEQVAILDGGLDKWKREGRPLECGEPSPREVRFEAAEKPGEVVTLAQVIAGVATLVDARGKGRFEGTEADPRLGVAAGHHRLIERADRFGGIARDRIAAFARADRTGAPSLCSSHRRDAVPRSVAPASWTAS